MSEAKPLDLTCDKCHNDYQATAENAHAFLYVTEHRCNHVKTTCPSCGHKETVFLAPKAFASAICYGHLAVGIAPHAGGNLRVRAERAWRHAEKDSREAPEPLIAGSTGRPPASPAGSSVKDATAPAPEPPTYELTQRLEDEVARFARTLGTMPDDLIRDELTGEHDRKHPDRWID